MFFYVYLLQSQVVKQSSTTWQSLKNKELYIGYTNDLRKRLEKHNRKLNFSTKSDTPWKLIFYEAYLNEEDAKRREKYLKTNQGSRLLKRMLKEHFYQEKFN